MNILVYAACVVAVVSALSKALVACIENDGGGNTSAHGSTGILFLRLIVAASVLLCAWRAWP